MLFSRVRSWMESQGGFSQQVPVLKKKNREKKLGWKPWTQAISYIHTWSIRLGTVSHEKILSRLQLREFHDIIDTYLKYILTSGDSNCFGLLGLTSAYIRSISFGFISTYMYCLGIAWMAKALYLSVQKYCEVCSSRGTFEYAIHYRCPTSGWYPYKQQYLHTKTSSTSHHTVMQLWHLQIHLHIAVLWLLLMNQQHMVGSELRQAVSKIQTKTWSAHSKTVQLASCNSNLFNSCYSR